MKRTGILATVLAPAVLAGCQAHTLVPLCPKIAEISYDPPHPGALVNRLVAEQAQERHVQISILSPFVAELSGPAHEIEWFKRNYRFMLCGFDPRLVIEDASTYERIMLGAAEWQTVLQSPHPEQLMGTTIRYAPLCCPDTANTTLGRADGP